MSDTFENFDLALNPGMREACNQCQRLTTGDAWCALLAGEYGTGKSHLAIATINAIGVNNGYFWKVPDFLEWLREKAYGDEKFPIDTLLRGYRGGQFLLVFDDYGTEKATDWASEQLYRVLDSRYDLRLPTIITTNQPVNRIDGRIISRFSEGLVVCRGKDIRRRPQVAR